MCELYVLSYIQCSGTGDTESGSLVHYHKTPPNDKIMMRLNLQLIYDLLLRSDLNINNLLFCNKADQNKLMRYLSPYFSVVLIYVLIVSHQGCIL